MKKQNCEAVSRQFPQLLLLEASAGSGKTHALSRRYVEFLLAPDVAYNKPGNLLAITFTKNAAREMKERILLWLKNLALGSDPAMMAEIQCLLSAAPERIADQARVQIGALLERYSDFQVQTIDSFTNRLAQASARELGFRPDFTVTTSQDELIEYALAKLYARIGPGRDEQLTKGMDRFLALVNTTRGGFVWDPRPRLSEQFSQFLGIEAKESGRLAFADQQQTIARLLGKLRRVHDEVKDFAAAHDLPFADDEKLLAFIAERQFDRIFGRKQYHGEHTPVKKTGLKKAQLPAYEQSKAIWAQTGPIVAGLAVAVAINDVAPYHLPYDAFKQELDQAKRRQGVYYIDDIARTLAESLRTEMIPEIYLALGERIHHYLIDEFQDTDPAQWRSLHPLLCETLAADGSVFLVGDLKQAIYMFRKADYRIMRGLRAEIERQAPLRWLPASVAENATVSHLEHNFRSGQVIVEYVDQIFKKILPQLITAGRLKPDRSGLTGYQQTPSPDNMGRGHVSVRHFMTVADDPSDDSGVASDTAAAEQDADGTGIQTPSIDAVRQALLAIIMDATDRGYGYGDIAVLAAYNSELEQAIDWLTQANIPAASSSGLDIRRRKAVAELLALLGWLHSPIDNLAWGAVVNSEMLRRAAHRDGIPWGAAQAQALLVAAGQRAGQHGYLYQECRKEPSFAAIWQRYCEGLYNVAGFSPVYDLACLAVTAFSLMSTTPEESAAVLQLLEAINRHETEDHGSLGDFLDRCEAAESEDFGLELPTGLPAVQLLSFHKAKGMGFPVVINLLSGGGGGKAAYYEAKDGTITVYHITKPLAARTAGYPVDLEALRADRDADDQVQRLNSLYVACTRARDELYNLVTCPPPDATGNLPLYQALFPELERGTKSRRDGKDAVAAPPLKLPEVPPTLPAARWQQQDAWTAARYTESRKGEYLHRVLQDIEYLPDSIEELAGKLLQRHRRTAPDCDPDSLHSPLCAFLKNPALGEWFAPREGRSVRREPEFITADGSIVRMDRLVIDPGAITVIDFKTGGENPAGQQGHRLQLSRYIEVLREVYSGRSITGLIAYWDGTIIEVRL